MRGNKVSVQLAYGESAEMYLKAIGELTLEEPLLPISNLADRLGISPVSATEMVHRIEDQGLVEHERYKGVRLTDAGRRRAMMVIRRHRLWERFLTDKLKLPWEDVHDLACRLEHAAGQSVTDAMADFLAEPPLCPHGNPIPNTAGELEVKKGIQLDSLRQGDGGVILRIRPETQEVLSYFAEKGIKPGLRIGVKSIDEFDGLRTISVNGKEHILGRRMSSHIVIAA
jgi:DtxR family Mn-dependent transcriptional regulator